MRGDDYIVEREQTGEYIIVDDAVGLIFIKVFAFFLVYVESCGTYFLVLQSFNQRIGMNQLPATGIDNHYSVFHFADGVVVYQVFGLFSERTV